MPAPGVPVTHGEWHARFPELGQLLGGWFSQDMPDEFGGHEAAVADYLAGTDRSVVARLAGEVRELLTLPLDDDLALAVAELGMEVRPPEPLTPAAWPARLADEVAAAR